jgi:hypothetical protein
VTTAGDLQRHRRLPPFPLLMEKRPSLALQEFSFFLSPAFGSRYISRYAMDDPFAPLLPSLLIIYI